MTRWQRFVVRGLAFGMVTGSIYLIRHGTLVGVLLAALLLVTAIDIIAGIADEGVRTRSGRGDKSDG